MILLKELTYREDETFSEFTTRLEGYQQLFRVLALQNSLQRVTHEKKLTKSLHGSILVFVLLRVSSSAIIIMIF